MQNVQQMSYVGKNNDYGPGLDILMLRSTQPSIVGMVKLEQVQASDFDERLSANI